MAKAASTATSSGPTGLMLNSSKVVGDELIGALDAPRIILTVMLLSRLIGCLVVFAISFGTISLVAQDRASDSVTADLRSALDTIIGPAILSHVKTLASDEFEGRAPGTRGEDLTAKYLIDQFKAAGAAPGNPNGTYIQNVPLVGYKTKPNIDLTVGEKSIPFTFLDDFVHDYPRLTPRVRVPLAEVVFAGYGITAPQYQWDDYKNTDIRGKLVLVLNGEPSKPLSEESKKLDPDFFKGVVRTYYSTREFKVRGSAQAWGCRSFDNLRS
ncbi:MAG: hypothetical protein AB7F88_04610 [Pyrinomonadaceae bacterium]